MLGGREPTVLRVGVKVHVLGELGEARIERRVGNRIGDDPSFREALREYPRSDTALDLVRESNAFSEPARFVRDYRRGAAGRHEDLVEADPLEVRVEADAPRHEDGPLFE